MICIVNAILNRWMSCYFTEDSIITFSAYSMCYAWSGTQNNSLNHSDVVFSLHKVPTRSNKKQTIKDHSNICMLHGNPIGGWANYCAPVPSGDLGMTVHRRGVRTSRFNKLTCSLWRLHLIAWEEKMKDVRQMQVTDIQAGYKVTGKIITAIPDIIKGEIRFLFKSRINDWKMKPTAKYGMQNQKAKETHKWPSTPNLYSIWSSWYCSTFFFIFVKKVTIFYK